MPASDRFYQQITTMPGSLQIISAQDELFNHVDAGEYMWAGDGPRQVRVDFSFAQPFAAAPVVTTALTGIDSSQSENLRFNIRCEDISAQGFSLLFDTWDNTHIARAGVSWTAHGLAPVTPRGTIAAHAKDDPVKPLKG